MLNHQILQKKKYNLEFQTADESATFAVGEKLASLVHPGAVIAFFGDLGAGKTALIKGLASAFGSINPLEINSPTFTYLHIYQGSAIVHHFDLYRLDNVSDFLNRGLDELLTCSGVSCVEWAERITPLLPTDCIRVTIKAINEGTRLISVEGLTDG